MQGTSEEECDDPGNPGDPNDPSPDPNDPGGGNGVIGVIGPNPNKPGGPGGGSSSKSTPRPRPSYKPTKPVPAKPIPLPPNLPKPLPRPKPPAKPLCEQKTFEERQYLFCRNEVNRQTAVDMCSAAGKYSLTAVNTAGELWWISATKRQIGINGSLWVGLFQRWDQKAPHHEWYWINNGRDADIPQPLVEDWWADDFPRDQAGDEQEKNRANFGILTTSGEQVVDVSPNTRHAFVCEAAPVVTDAPAPPETPVAPADISEKLTFYPQDIVYGGDRFVAVGTYGEAAYSKDGIQWTTISIKQLLGRTLTPHIAYGNGKFVVVGDGEAAYSDDGVKWAATDIKFARSTTPGDSVRADGISFANGRFFAFGFDKTASSTDGMDWSLIDVGLGQGDVVPSITYGNGKFVGHRYKTTVTSEDGISWTSYPVGDTPPKYPFGNTTHGPLTFAEGKFVMTGPAELAAYSEDGINWTEAIIPLLHRPPFNENVGGLSRDRFRIVYGNDRFVSLGQHNLNAYSDDGVNWMAMPDIGNHPFHLDSYPIVAFGGDKFIAAGYSGYAYSYNGVDWTVLPYGNK
ncbi:MAG: hypothetical protein WD200_00805 [Candidatus Andersenbacteria bacterium]